MSSILRDHQDINVVATCNDGLTALNAIRELVPDVAMLDIALPDMNGLDILSLVSTDQLKTKVVFLTAAVSDEQTLSAIARGAKGVLLKDAAPGSLVDCIRDVAAGKQWFPAEVIAGAFRRKVGPHGPNLRDFDDLTVREREIAVLVSEGLSNKEIANQTKLTQGTIKVYLHNIYAKLHIRN